MSDKTDPEIPREVAEKLAAEGDHVMQMMLEHNVPLTREGYLIWGMYDLDEGQQGLTAEQEMTVPEPLRLKREE